MVLGHISHRRDSNTYLWYISMAFERSEQIGSQKANRFVKNGLSDRYQTAPPLFWQVPQGCLLYHIHDVPGRHIHHACSALARNHNPTDGPNVLLGILGELGSKSLAYRAPLHVDFINHTNSSHVFPIASDSSR